MAKTIIHTHKLANGRGDQKKASNDVFEWKVKMVSILIIVMNPVQKKKENKYMLAAAFITEYGYTQANTSRY